MDRRAWRATVHRVSKSWTQLKWLSMHVHTLLCIHPLFSSLIHLSIFAGLTCSSPIIPCIIHLTINTTPVHFSQSCRISFLVSSSLFCWWLSSSELWFGSPLISGPKNLKFKKKKKKLLQSLMSEIWFLCFPIIFHFLKSVYIKFWFCDLCICIHY